MLAISSWGRLSADSHDVRQASDRRQLAQLLAQSKPGLPHGMARSYGDVCLNANGVLWQTVQLDRFISFDPTSGKLVCEAGVLLRDIQRLALPHGWMLPVTPGTQMVTVGGAIANDVHGKNHHVLGSFGDHVDSIQLQRTDGELIDCGPQQRRDWFCATVGGLGLTGLIVSAQLQLRQVAGPWLTTETIPYASLEEFFQLADQSEAGWEYTVSWIDCLAQGSGRGLFMRANPAKVSDGPKPRPGTLTVPFVPPFSLVNSVAMRPFNSAYFNLNKRKQSQTLTHYEPFFYPLDNLLQWNRLYGPKGFFQYQCVVPRDSGDASIQAMLDEIVRSQQGSFLAVLKTFGNREPLGMLSFVQPGVTLAVDFPNLGPRTLDLLNRLDSIVRQAGGRIYMAKDARMPRDLFVAGYPKLTQFLPYRDPGISSSMSRRLMGY